MKETPEIKSINKHTTKLAKKPFVPKQNSNIKPEWILIDNGEEIVEDIIA